MSAGRLRRRNCRSMLRTPLMLDRALGFGGSKNGALGIPRSLKDGERDRGSLHRSAYGE